MYPLQGEEVGSVAGSPQHLVLVAEGSHPALVLSCLALARDGAIFFWVRRHKDFWHIKAFSSDAEGLARLEEFPPETITRQPGDGVLWTANFQDHHIHRLLSYLFPLQYRRLHEPENWPVRRGTGCFHTRIYLWGPLPTRGLAMVCLGCFKVGQVEKLELTEVLRAMTTRRQPHIYLRTPVVDGEILVPMVMM